MHMVSITVGRKGELGQANERFGRDQLGWHAFEKHMPGRIIRLISQSDTVQHGIDGLVPILDHLLRNDGDVARARLCSPKAQYVGKLRHGLQGEGHNFCGYHNLQMQLAFLRNICAGSAAGFAAGVPSILGIQDLIEQAWDQGHNAQGRIQTGGIRGTRKHIGTQEAQATLRLLGQRTRANVFSSAQSGDASKSVFDQLLDFVDGYFGCGSGASDAHERVLVTDRPPVYLQFPGHSMTIVGIEATDSGERSLLVFDPATDLSKRVLCLGGPMADIPSPQRTLRPFRRGRHQMRRAAAFETLHCIVES